MIDSRTILSNAARYLDGALHRYENGEDTLLLAERLLRLHRMLKKARSALIREQLEVLLTKPTLERKDRATLEKLLGAMLQERSHR